MEHQPLHQQLNLTGDDLLDLMVVITTAQMRLVVRTETLRKDKADATRIHQMERRGTRLRNLGNRVGSALKKLNHKCSDHPQEIHHATAKLRTPRL